MAYKEILKQGNDLFLANLSIDLVIVGYSDNVLKSLLLRIGEKWVLPGGFIRKDESVDEAARNILHQRTRLDDASLSFLSVFGDKERQFKEMWKEQIKRTGLEWRADYWFNERFVSLVYYSLVNIENTHPSVGHLDEAYGWFDFAFLPDMWMDHKSIASFARQHIKQDIRYQNTAYRLLPEQFTMPELHQLYQVILEEEIDRSRFQKKMLGTGMFERLPELQKNTPGRNPYQYRVRKTTGRI